MIPVTLAATVASALRELDGLVGRRKGQAVSGSYLHWSSDGVRIKDGPAVYIQWYRVRKRPCLVIYEGSVVRPLAYFRTEDDARTFADALGITISDHEKDKP
jgi:hypothetical protein